ncbi:TetR/AcrR family transcriptional regulator [Actinomadura roseirufa]|uniref:TetR/AcrR family transcriptional regulator n=1 Tax=Actinomadura roseirufa TaxID=2094049 RepID=UPI0013F1491F|nr:TetR/AcrR family transcriptional regulator [Actinomadura roseirufa]
MGTPPLPGPTGRYHGRAAAERRAERRERLLSAGLELFGTLGYAATSVERLCAAAGLSTRQFYQEFANRDAVLAALYEQVNGHAFAAVSAALDEAAGAAAAERVRRVVRAYVTVTVTDPRRARIACVECAGAGPAVQEHRREWSRRWAALLAAVGETAGARRPAPRDAHLAAVGFAGAANALLHEWCTADPRPPLESVTGLLTRMLASVLCTAPACP